MEFWACDWDCGDCEKTDCPDAVWVEDEKIKTHATLTSYEPPHQHEKWGSVCIEVATTGTIACSSACLSERGVKKVKRGGIVRFFPSDIDYRDLRPLFGEI